MIHSMTAFARRQCQGEWGTLSLELRSVNHRFLEMALRLPEELRELEPEFRGRIGKVLGRGKVDCNLRYQPGAAVTEKLEINQGLASRLAHLSREVDGLLYNAAPVSSLEVLKWPGVVQAQLTEPGDNSLSGEALRLLDDALVELRETRRREGDKLKAGIEQRCAAMVEVVAQLRTRLPEVKQHYRERLHGRLQEIRAELDPARLEQEMVLFAQKIDVDEELDRLQAHFSEVRRVLEQEQPVGRRLDFLMQELNREANTLASKSVDMESTRAAVELKVLIEQMREQVQNIE